MSTRAFRKLHGGQDLSDLSKFEVSHDPDEDPDTQPTAPAKSKKKHKNKTAAPPVNPFDLLNEDEERTESKENVQNGLQEDDSLENVECGKTIETQSAKKKKKKKKKKKTEPFCPETHDDNKTEDDIEASVRQVNEMLGEMPTRVTSVTTGSQAYRTLLGIEHKHLNPDNEMRKMFGSRVVQSEPSRDRRQRNRAARRNTWLVQPKNSWPALSKTGLGMDLVDGGHSKSQHFEFTHNKEYQKIQYQFLDAVESMDPQSLINMAQLYPHHIDTLLQVSEICKMSEDVQMATEFIERALYIFECAFHSLFSLTQDNVRLDYKCQENRSFYIALFRHLNFIGKKGCYRTALEFCKLLLSLDPDGDPLCVLLMIDFYALRSDQYDFLVKLYQEWEAHRNLSQLPNFALSVALAMFHQAEQEHSDTETSDKMLQEGLIMFPGVLLILLDKCSIVPDAEVSKHSFFGVKAQYGQSKALEQLLALYVGRTSSCWKTPEVVAWLERNVKTVLKRVDEKDPFVEDCENKRRVRYQGTPKNIHRHIMISEIPAATAALPPDLAHTPVMSYDPLPPADSVAAYTRPARANRAIGGGNPLSLFFQSLMPNFNPQEAAQVEQGAVGGEGRNFRDGVAQVMDAMRDLLNNIQPVAPPVENAGNGENEDDEENHDWD